MRSSTSSPKKESKNAPEPIADPPAKETSEEEAVVEKTIDEEPSASRSVVEDGRGEPERGLLP